MLDDGVLDFLPRQFRDVLATEANLKTFSQWCCLHSEGHVPVFVFLFSVSFILIWIQAQEFLPPHLTHSSTSQRPRWISVVKRHSNATHSIPSFLHNSCLDTRLVFQCGSCCRDVLTFERVIYFFLACCSKSSHVEVMCECMMAGKQTIEMRKK